MNKIYRILFCSIIACMLYGNNPALAQRPPMMPPAFMGGPPGMMQMQAITMQRHQARTLLYREALEELRKNPQAADVPTCPTIAAKTRTLCIRRPATSSTNNATSLDSAPRKTTSGSLDEPISLSPDRHRRALLIGNNAYSQPIPALNTPIHDVDQIAEVLRRQFGYETRVLHNASKEEIVEAFNTMADQAKPEDSVLLFYAGHGYLIEDTGMGFWIPVNGSTKTAAQWISNSDISKLLQAIAARQIILVSDSCFSGSLTREQKLSTGFAAKSADALRQRSVLAFSSGGEEPVSDEGKGGHSIFAWHLINTLKSVSGNQLGFDIYRSVHDAVKKDFPQEPQYGGVITAGHTSGGEFLFDRRNN